MNTKNSLSLLFILMLALGACNKHLDIAPEGVMTEQSALEEQRTAEDMLAGAYQQMFLAMSGDAYTIGDLTTGIATATTNEWYTGMVEPNDGVVAGFWDDAYAAINLANVIINQLPRYARFDPAVQKQFVAESRFVRAFSYLQLIKLFGDGALENKPEGLSVPLRLEGFEGYDGSQIIPRSTNKEIFSLIRSDLDSAIARLPEKYDVLVNTYCRATKASAAALAARVALYMRDYEACITYCDIALSDPGHVLAASPKDVFQDNTNGNSVDYPFDKEVLFAFPVSYNKDPTQYAKHNIYYVQGYIKPDSAFVASYAPEDLRKTVMIDTVATYNGDIAVTVKFSDPNRLDNLVMLRLAEVLLNKAEAMVFKDGVSQGAVDLLNKVHQRAFAPENKPPVYVPGDFANREALIHQILQEKKWELAFEGLDRYDEIAAGVKPNDQLPENKYALPIPQYDVEITGGIIKQNPGYIK